MSPNNGILFNGVLSPKLLNNHFAFCSFKNLDFLPLRTTNFEIKVVLLFLVVNTFSHFLYLFLALQTIFQHVL